MWLSWYVRYLMQFSSNTLSPISCERRQIIHDMSKTPLWHGKPLVFHTKLIFIFYFFRRGGGSPNESGFPQTSFFSGTMYMFHLHTKYNITPWRQFTSILFVHWFHPLKATVEMPVYMSTKLIKSESIFILQSCSWQPGTLQFLYITHNVSFFLLFGTNQFGSHFLCSRPFLLHMSTKLLKAKPTFSNHFNYCGDQQKYAEWTSDSGVITHGINVSNTDWTRAFPA